MISPNDFLRLLRESDEFIEVIYLNGGCYKLSNILKEIYEGSVQYVVSYEGINYDHVITKIEDKYYDIKGEVDLTKYAAILEIQSDMIPCIAKWSFSKKNLLYKLCPHCLEEIYIDKDCELLEV